MLPLTSQNITLCDWQESDLEAYAYWLQPHHTWQKLDAPYYPPPTPTEIPPMIENLRQKIIAAQWPTPRHRLAITHQGELIGMVSRYWISEETHWSAVGIVIYDSAHWGKGWGYEALGLWSAYLFETMPQIIRLDLRTWSGNKGMMRLAEKLGYTQEACFRQARIVEGQYYDGLGYGVLRSEWESRYPRGFANIP